VSLRLENKTAIVVGAGSIGPGWGNGKATEACQADAANAQDIERAITTCVDHFGGVDVLDNNVGIVEVGGVVDLAEEAWDRIFAINLKSCFLAMKYVIPVMERAGGGAIINISSIAAIRHTGVPYASYYTTKAAMNQLTSTTAVEYAPKGIHHRRGARSRRRDNAEVRLSRTTALREPGAPSGNERVARTGRRRSAWALLSRLVSEFT